MKKFWVALFSASLLFLFVFNAVLAQDERPRGLTDRGPLTKITFIHYRKGYAKPPGTPGSGDKGGPSCYGFLGKGVLWKNLPQPIYINPDNGDGMAENFVLSTFDRSAKTWDAVTGSVLYSGYSIDNNANWDDSAPDTRNELSFGNYPNNGVIAVTNVWGYFGGPPSTREIVEFDILFNESFTWGNADDNSSLMDLENIATHELGHGWGLGDIYDAGCSAVTMYGYSNVGEKDKRTLEAPDITGITQLYN